MLDFEGRRRRIPEQPVERKLAAILAADIAGYSRLIGLDEEGTLAGCAPCAANSSIRRLPNTAAVFLKPPATAYSSSSPASSTRCAVPSRCSERLPRARPPSLKIGGSN